MLVNKVKTKLMVINGDKFDREIITVENIKVEHTTSYIYLGSPFTEDAKMKSVFELHAKTRISDLNKLKIFCHKNETMPFKYKKKVFDACIISSILYGCESVCFHILFCLRCFCKPVRCFCELCVFW